VRHKFDVKNDIGLWIGQPEGQVDAHLIWLPYFNKLVNRGGATKLNITQAQYDEYYGRQTQMLTRLPTANILNNLLDFGTLSLENTYTYNRAQQLQELDNPTLMSAPTPMPFTTHNNISSVDTGELAVDQYVTDEIYTPSEGVVVLPDQSMPSSDLFFLYLLVYLTLLLQRLLLLTGMKKQLLTLLNLIRVLKTIG
jgi:hypothetical protein